MKLINIYSITQEFNNDLTTPMAAYLKLNESDAFFLESVEKGTAIGRYSMIGFDPLLKVQGYDDYMALIKEQAPTVMDGDPLQRLNLLYKNIKHHQTGGTPIKNGFFGHFTWEIISKIEAVDVQRKHDQLYEFQWPSTLIIFDHVQQSIHITISQFDSFDASDKINQVLQKIQRPLPATKHMTIIQPTDIDWGQVRTNWSKEGFKDGVEKIKQHIKEGDIFQGVISQKFRVTSDQDSLSVYRALRHINPSPYMFYFNYGNYQLIGSSPEVLVKASNGRATVRPIAGTRKRSFGDESALVDELKNDEKEIAEHIMLVDLGRNDLGRVCNNKTVTVSDLMTIETYSHVIHMVTNVEGELLHGVTPIDLLKAVFPAGTVSGAPKVRAIEIVNDIEPDPRHIYSGAVGYFNMEGDVDFCIAIRTIVRDEEGRYEVQAGAGIVNDSVPENEYKETLNKAQGVLMACLTKGDIQ